MVVVDNKKTPIVFSHIESMREAVCFPFGLSEITEEQYALLKNDEFVSYYFTKGFLVVKKESINWEQFNKDTMTKKELHNLALNDYGITLKQNKSFENMLVDFKEEYEG